MDRVPLRLGIEGSKHAKEGSHIAKASLCCSPKRLCDRLNLNTRHQSKWDYEILHQPVPRWRKEILRAVNSIAYQAGIMLFIFFDFGLTVHDLSVDANSDDAVLNSLNALVLVVLSVDIVLRLAAEGKAFFAEKLNLFEMCIVVICLVFYFVETEIPFSFGRTLRPLFRAMKVVRLVSKAALGQRRVGERFDRLVEGMVDSMRERLLGDVLLVPPKNLRIDAREGFLRLEKVQLIPDVFDGLHLPFAIKGGFVELMYVDLNRKRRDHGVCVVVRNMLLVVGPGHHQMSPAVPWTYDAVLEAKGRLLEVISRRMDAFVAKQEEGETKNLSLGARVAARLRHEVMEALRSQVHVDIRNIVVQYEDPKAELHNAPVLGGFKLGQLRAALVSKGQSQDSSLDSKFRALGCRRMIEISPEVYEHASKDTVRIEVALSRVSIWWDVRPVSPFYTHLLQDRHEIAKAIRHHKRSDIRERLCAAIVHRIRGPNVAGDGQEHGVLSRSAQKCREGLAAHRYILQPAALSVHVLLREKGSGYKELVNVDVDIAVKSMCIEVEMPQLASILQVMAYTRRWLQDDKDFQWRPTSSLQEINCAASLLDSIEEAKARRATVRAWWHFALQGVLRAIDPAEEWKVLTWLEVRRKAHLRQRYIDLFLHRLRCAREKQRQRSTKSLGVAQEIWSEDEERALEEIQVATPLWDLLVYRQLAHQLDAEEFKKVRSSDTERSSDTKHSSDVASSEIIINMSPEKPDQKHRRQNSLSPDKLDSHTGRTLLMGVSQIHFHLERLTATVFDAPDANSTTCEASPWTTLTAPMSAWQKALRGWIRRPLVELKLRHSKVMLCIDASPDTNTSCDDEKCSFLTELEADIGSLQALYCGAPTSVPVLRHIIRRTPAAMHEELAPVVRISARRTYYELDHLVHSVVNLQVPAIAIVLYRPLITQLSADFHNHAWQRRCTEIADESFNHLVLAARSKLQARRSKDLGWKKQRRLFEHLTKSDASDSKLSTQTIVSLGALEIVTIQPFTSQRYLEQRLLLPPVLQEFNQKSDEQAPFASAAVLVGSEVQTCSPPQTPTEVTSSSIVSRPISCSSTSTLLSNSRLSDILEHEDGAILLNSSDAHRPIMNPLPLPGIALQGHGPDVSTWIANFRSSVTNLIGCKPPCPCSNRNDLGVLWTPHSSPRVDDMANKEQDWEWNPGEYLWSSGSMRLPEESWSSQGSISMTVVDADGLGHIHLTDKVSEGQIADENLFPLEKIADESSSPLKRMSDRSSNLSTYSALGKRALSDKGSNPSSPGKVQHRQQSSHTDCCVKLKAAERTALW